MTAKHLHIDVEALLRRAAPLHCSAGTTLFQNCRPTSDDEIFAKRIQRWRDLAARNDELQFRRRLSWNDLSTESAALAVASERPLLKEDEPWASGTRRLIHYLEQGGGRRHPQGIGAKRGRTELPSSIPFAPVLAAVIAFAEAEMDRSSRWPSLSRPVRRQLLASLCRRLSNVSDRSLGLEFRKFRNARHSPEGCWDAFVEHMQSGGLLRLLERLPVLARLMATVVNFWIEDTSEFLARLAEDGTRIVDFLGQNPGEIAEVQCDLSDPHRGGRKVRIVHFASGAGIVYKPRRLDMDLAWFQFTEWLRRQDPRLEIRAPRVLHRGGWGWVELMKHEPCLDLEAVARYYWRAGCLLCLLYATSATDFHAENLLACGEYPVPIDLETLCLPDLKDSLSEVAFPMRRSVLRIGLLPEWQDIGSGKAAIDFSGFGSTEETLPLSTFESWIHENSDEMEYVEIRDRRAPSQNLPFLRHGKCPDPGAFVDRITDGFRMTYGFLLSHKDDLLSPFSPLTAFRSCRTRIVFRKTDLYRSLWERSVNPLFLSSGVDRSIELEGLSRHYLGLGERHDRREMFRAEIASLEQLDVPLFESVVDTKELLDSYGCGLKIDGLIQVPGYANALRGVSGMSAEDCDSQIESIRASFAARAMRDSHEAQPKADPGLCNSSECRLPRLHPSQFLFAACEIAHALVRKAVRIEGQTSWIGFNVLPASGYLKVNALGPSLYGGSPGLALFLAAMFALEGREEHRDAALGVIRSLKRTFLTSAGGEPVSPLAAARFLASGIGAGVGGGSTIYAIHAAGKLIDAPESHKIALGLSRLIDARAICADRHLDVMGGAAGAILALLALWKETHEPELLEKALLCGEHLMRSRISQNGAPQSWQTIGSASLAGFSHGVAGIGLALLRLYKASNDIRFRDAAIEGFAYERTLFSPETCNWADLREGIAADPGFGSWCHGAPGIALSRLAALEIVDDPLIRSDLDSGLQFLVRSQIDSNGTLCCGETGKADILLEAGRRLARPELISLAQDRASAVAAGVASSDTSMLLLGLFQGIAGVGYGLLRQAAPDRLPSILLWD